MIFKMRNLFFLLFVVVLGASCVPNKKIVYLQKGDELNESFPKDTVLRVYDLADYEYRIQPEDILSIRFESLTDEEYDFFSRSNIQNSTNAANIAVNGHLVDKHGTINLPEIGKVEVAGLTVHQIRDTLQEITTQYLRAPVVNVRLLNFRITLLGEVNSEGTVNSYNNRISIMEAVGLGGGLTELADRSKVKVIRQQRGQTEVLYVNLLNENLMQESSFFVHQNDIIIVPPLKQRPFRRYFGQNVALFLSSVSTLLLIINLVK